MKLRADLQRHALPQIDAMPQDADAVQTLQRAETFPIPRAAALVQQQISAQIAGCNQLLHQRNQYCFWLVRWNQHNRFGGDHAAFQGPLPNGKSPPTSTCRVSGILRNDSERIPNAAGEDRLRDNRTS